MTLKNTLDALPDKDRAILMYALTHNVTQYIEFAPGQYIGVNTETIPHLKPEFQTGKWAKGRIVKC